MTTKPQTDTKQASLDEARAILSGRRLAFNDESGAQALIDAIATALAAKDAELAEAKRRNEELEREVTGLRNSYFAERRQLAEANRRIAEKDKALERVDKKAVEGSNWNKGRTETSPRDCHNFFAEIIQIARRVREAQKDNTHG